MRKTIYIKYDFLYQFHKKNYSFYLKPTIKVKEIHLEERKGAWLRSKNQLWGSADSKIATLIGSLFLVNAGKEMISLEFFFLFGIECLEFYFCCFHGAKGLKLGTLLFSCCIEKNDVENISCRSLIGDLYNIMFILLDKGKIIN